jgi:hypothetical protein
MRQLSAGAPNSKEKWGERAVARPRANSNSHSLDVLSFGTFIAVDDFEVDHFSFLQGFET